MLDMLQVYAIQINRYVLVLNLKRYIIHFMKMDTI